MTQELKQFNFKLPASLLDQLKELSKAKDVTATELVIQGIQHVLGFKPDSPQISGIDSGLYQQLDALELRIQDLVDYQSTIDLNMDKRIKALEETVETLKNRLSAVNIVEDILKDISATNNSNAEKSEVATEDSTAQENIAIYIDRELDKELPEDPISADTSSLDSNIAVDIDNQTESLTPEVDSTKATQLELVNLENDESNLRTRSQIVDSIEMLKTLRAEDPQGRWDNDRLTNHRRYKKLKDKWHNAGTLRFRYTGESQKAPNSNKAIHLWQITQSGKA